jgi:hypothetical protein
MSDVPILVHGDYPITGYGFAAWKDKVAVLHRKTGRKVLTRAVPKAPEEFRIDGDTLEVLVHDAEEPIRFAKKDFMPSAPDARGRTRPGRPSLTLPR